jgi:RNA-directed DNA polymerase
MRQQVRRWRLHLRIGPILADLAHMINPIVRGWMQDYGAFYRSALDPLLKRINSNLMRYLRRKFKRLRPFRKALACWSRITSQQPALFAHWASGTALW